MITLLKRLIGIEADARTETTRTAAARRPRRAAGLHCETLEQRQVLSGVWPFGINPGLMSHMQGAYQVARHAPSIFTPQQVSPAVQQAMLSNVMPAGFSTNAIGRPTVVQPGYSSTFEDRIVGQALGLANQGNLNGAVNYLNYANSTRGQADLLSAFGYGRINNLTASTNDLNMILNDPWLGRQTGQIGINAAFDYFQTNHAPNGLRNVNVAGIGHDAGLHPGTQANLALLQGLPGFQSRPFGTGSGSPLIDSFGPPIGSAPQERFTFGGGTTVASPMTQLFGAPVGHRPWDGTFVGSTAWNATALRPW